jgi:uncharacterized protein YndB with AHSA1/START domain
MEQTMTERTTEHGTFTIERTLKASPSRVFAAWSDRAAKARWFSESGEPDPEYDLDFRVGGTEISRGQAPDGFRYTYDARYAEIVPDRRIAYSYTMDRGETRISVSVTTVEFLASGTGTALILTEHGAFFDGGDKPEYREEGTRSLIDGLEAALDQRDS